MAKNILYLQRQNVVILAIVAVIIALFTVSAVSNEVGYKVSPCDAIDISIENTTVTDFLNATNMTTVQVSNFKGYKGENTWMVQWYSSNRLLNVYVNVATGDIIGIEEKTGLSPISTPTPEPKTWHSVITFTGSEDETTSPFTIRGDVWQVKWSVGSCSEYPIFTVFVYPMGKHVRDVNFWSCSKESYSGTQYIYRGGGDYYFKIDTANLYSWELEVEE